MFLNNYLQENIMPLIEIDTLQLQKDSFINEEIRRH
ncbi:MAG TPA: Rpn family recombination-promoting nuclease/putative transposase [Thermoanaerobacterales bacterium]|nr:Rpn family recombination-promoting nuclease/putative transposase [Thermoanaerobacterales bacterium]